MNGRVRRAPHSAPAAWDRCREMEKLAPGLPPHGLEDRDAIRLRSREYEEGVECVGECKGGINAEMHAQGVVGEQEVRALRSALRRSAVQIETQGHLREYLPRRPSVLPVSALYRHHGTPRSRRAAASRQGHCAGSSLHTDLVAKSDVMSQVETLSPRHVTSPALEPRGDKLRTTLSPPEIQKIELVRELNHEVHQVRELEQRYEDTKRVLLEYMDVIITCKPNDRVGGQEVYEQLADFMVFASHLEESTQQN